MEKPDRSGEDRADEKKRLWAEFARTGRVCDYLKYSRCGRSEPGEKR